MNKKERLSLQEAYNKVCENTKTVLTEMPFRPKPDGGFEKLTGETDLDPEKISADDPEEWKALHKYPKPTRNFQNLPDEKRIEVITKIVTAVAAEVAEQMKEGGGRVEDSRREFQYRLADIIKSAFSAQFAPNHAPHIARNVVDALERAGAIEEFDKAPKKAPKNAPVRRDAADLW